MKTFSHTMAATIASLAVAGVAAILLGNTVAVGLGRDVLSSLGIASCASALAALLVHMYRSKLDKFNLEAQKQVAEQTEIQTKWL